MASGRKIAEVFVEVRADLSKLKKGMKSAMSIASGGASVIGKVLGGLASLIKNVLTAAFKVVGAVIKTVFNLVSALFSSIIKWAKRGVLALSAFVALSVVVGAKFGQSMARVKALTGATTKEFKALREEARRLGRATEYSANQAADAMSIFAMAGFKTNDVITAMTPTLDFAAASGLDLASAADIAARVMGGMQLEAKDLSHTMDVLTKAFTSANMDATDLGEAMKYVGAVGKTVGKDVEEIVGSLTALAAAGNRGSMAGTGLRKVLMGLATSKVQKKIAALGVSVTDASGAMKPMSKLIGDLVKATKNLSDMEIADLGVQMFGARGGVAFLQLIGQGEAAIQKYTAQLANVDGFTKQIAATQRDTLATAFKIVQSAVADVMITITDILEPTLRGAAGSQVKMWNKIGEVLEANKTRIQDFIKNAITWIKTKLPDAIHIAVGAVSQLWDEFSQTFNNIKALVLDVTEGAGSAFTDFLRYDETTGSGIERVLTSIVIGLVRVGQEIRNVFEDMRVGLTNLGVKPLGWITESVGSFGQGMVEGITDIFGGSSVGGLFDRMRVAGGIVKGGVGIDKESRAEADEAQIDSILGSMNERFANRETLKEAKEEGKEVLEGWGQTLKEMAFGVDPHKQEKLRIAELEKFMQSMSKKIEEAPTKEKKTIKELDEVMASASHRLSTNRSVATSQKMQHILSGADTQAPEELTQKIQQVVVEDSDTKEPEELTQKITQTLTEAGFQKPEELVQKIQQVLLGTDSQAPEELTQQIQQVLIEAQAEKKVKEENDKKENELIDVFSDAKEKKRAIEDDIEREKARLREAYFTAKEKKEAIEEQIKPKEKTPEVSRHGMGWFRGKRDPLGLLKMANDAKLAADKAGAGRKIDVMPTQKKLEGSIATIETIVGSRNMRVAVEKDWAEDTAKSNRDILAVLKETKEPIKNNEKYNQSTSISSDKTAQSIKGQMK